MKASKDRKDYWGMYVDVQNTCHSTFELLSVVYQPDIPCTVQTTLANISFLNCQDGNLLYSDLLLIVLIMT